MPPAAKVIKDMTEMSKFVYDFYYKVIERLMKEQGEADKRREAEEAAFHRFQVGLVGVPEFCVPCITLALRTCQGLT